MIINSCNSKKISIDISLDDFNSSIGYSFVSNVATAEQTGGFFSTNSGNTAPTSITSLIVNLQNSESEDQTEALTYIGDQKLTLKIVDENNSDNSLEFKVDSYQIINNTHIVYTLDANQTTGTHNLIDNNNYCLQFNSCPSVTKTSDLTNDGDGNSPFATLLDLSNVNTGGTTNVSELNNDGDGTSPFATLADLNTQNISNLSELNNDGDGLSPFTTQNYVQNLINSINAHYGPYTSVANALAAIPAGSRTVGLTVLIYDLANSIQEEYWFKFGTADANLVSKCCGTDNSNNEDPTPTNNTTVYYGQSNSIPTSVNIKSFSSSTLTQNDTINAPFDAENVHFFTVPSGLSLESAVNSAIAADIFYSSTNNSYLTSTISIDDESHTLYYFQGLAPLGQDVIISLNLI
ncbi:hypothetical protein [Wenyingzhuangia sp. IMCC45574]